MTDISGLRPGVEVAGVAGSSPKRATAKGIAPVYGSLEEPLADAERAWVNVQTTEVRG